MEKLKYQRLLKVESLLAAQEKIKEIETTHSLQSLMMEQLQGLPLQLTARRRASAPLPPRGPLASPPSIRRASPSRPPWPPSSTGELGEQAGRGGGKNEAGIKGQGRRKEALMMDARRLQGVEKEAGQVKA